MISFLHNHLPNEIFLNIGFIKIYYYGLIFTLAFIVGYFFINKFTKRKNIETNQLFNLIFYVIIFSLISARLYYILFYNPIYFLNYPSEIIKIWHGGISLHGVFIGALLTIYFYTKKHRLNFWNFTDLFTLTFPLVQTIGRWGNYFNQELYGRPTDLPWGIPIDYQHRVAGYENFQYFQPTFLYESILDLFLFFLLVFLFYKKNLKTGTLTLFYLIGYSTIRFFMEFIRIDQAITIFGIRLPQIICLLIIIASLGILIKKPSGMGNS